MQAVGPTLTELLLEALASKDRPWLEDQLRELGLKELVPFDEEIARKIIAGIKMACFVEAVTGCTLAEAYLTLFKAGKLPYCAMLCE